MQNEKLFSKRRYKSHKHYTHTYILAPDTDIKKKFIEIQETVENVVLEWESGSNVNGGKIYSICSLILLLSLDEVKLSYCWKRCEFQILLVKNALIHKTVLSIKDWKKNTLNNFKMQCLQSRISDSEISTYFAPPIGK